MALQQLDKNNFESAVKTDSPVLVKYYMDGCGPCKMMAPIIEKLEPATTGVAFFEVNTDKNPTLAAQAKLTGVPTLVIYKNGEAVDRMVGFHNEQEVKAFIDKNAHK